MKELQGRVAVVTGAGSGIGRGLAVRFAQEGMQVVLTDIDEEALRALEGTLGPAAIAHVTDVSDEESVRALADRAYEAFGAVHVLCNNAGVVGPPGPVWESTAADWEWVLGVNLLGVVHGIRVFVPRMLTQGSDAHIVNTASLAGLVSFPGVGAYGASKHAVVTLSEQLALELREHGAAIGVSVLCPALVRTRIFEAERNRPARLRNPGQRPNLPDERVTEFSAAGLEPDVVADAVVNAIRDSRFSVLTHPEWLDAISARCAGIVEGTGPHTPKPSSSS
ncbi:MAG: SDR family NAD(P)-dependent oxidoreductase [Egibacteraceae bacterium]